MHPRLASVALSTVDADAATIIAAARTADEAGLHAVYCYDHISGASFQGHSSQHVWTILGAIAAATDRVQLGPLVANVTTRHAVDIASAVATLEQLSSGRLILGVGAGAGPESEFAAEMQMFRLPAESSALRRARVHDAVGFIHALWRGEQRFQSSNFSFGDVRGVSIPDRLCPIVIGVNGPKLAALAGDIADGVNVHWWQPDIDDVISIARRHAGQRGLQRFVVSVEVPLELTWIDANATWISKLDVDEVIYAWNDAIGLDLIGQVAGL